MEEETAPAELAATGEWLTVPGIEGWAFYRCDSLTDVYYGGTEAQWQTISESNTWLLDAVIHYNSTGNEVLSSQVEGGVLTVTVASKADTTAYCAFYDANRRMLRVTSETLTEELAELSFPIPGGAVWGKILLLSPWQHPMCPAKEVLIS